MLNLNTLSLNSHAIQYKKFDKGNNSHLPAIKADEICLSNNNSIKNAPIFGSTITQPPLRSLLEKLVEQKEPLTDEKIIWLDSRGEKNPWELRDIEEFYKYHGRFDKAAEAVMADIKYQIEGRGVNPSQILQVGRGSAGSMIIRLYDYCLQGKLTIRNKVVQDLITLVQEQRLDQTVKNTIFDKFLLDLPRLINPRHLADSGNN